MRQTYKKSYIDKQRLKDTSYLVQRHLSQEPIYKKCLKGKLLSRIKGSLILNEDKFNPLSFTESIAPRVEKQTQNKFKPLDDRVKVNIFTNARPHILEPGLHFYSRYFDYFRSPDEILKANFSPKEIALIMSDPLYFKFSSEFNSVEFFKKKTLTELLNEEDAIGTKKTISYNLNKSLNQTRKKIGNYLDYYTYVMSQKDFMQDRHTLTKRKEKDNKNKKTES